MANTEEYEWKKAINALNLELHHSIVADIKAKAEAYAQAQVTKSNRQLLDELEKTCIEPYSGRSWLDIRPDIFLAGFNRFIEAKRKQLEGK